MIGQISNKLRAVGHDFGYAKGGIGHWCPACHVMHVSETDAWDGDPENPTLAGETNFAWGVLRNPAFKSFGGGRCRYRIQGGIIHFERDCTHAMVGRSVPLPDLPGHLID